MDLDAYTTAHQAEWDRLRGLATTRQLDGRDSDELVALYQSGATQLSEIMTTAGDSASADRLSVAIARARLRFTGTPGNALPRLAEFFGAGLPAALYRVRWVTLVIVLLSAIVAVAYGIWFTVEPSHLAALGSEADLKKYADQEFTQYYSKSSIPAFAGQVWTHNAFLAAQSIAFGIIGVWVPYVLLQNAQNLGTSGAVMNHEGRLSDFFLYISPHGQLELYALFTASAAGLMIFWSWVAPGPRSRARALSENGRAFFAIVIGVIGMLLISGLIEGGVTRQPWPWPVKIGIGTVALTAVLLYQWVLGGRAWRAGRTGDLDEFEAGARQLVSG